MQKINRRNFLSAAAGLTAATLLGPTGRISNVVKSFSKVRNCPAIGDRKLIVVIFGGGTRSTESIDDPTHRYIPHLWNKMTPKGTLFMNMRVERKVVHPNSAGSIMTGHWEWDDVDWSKPVAHPTIFEIYRKAHNVPDAKTWAFVYASILAKIGESISSEYGHRYAANVVVPPTIPRTTAEEMDLRMQHAAALGSKKTQIKAANDCAALVRSTSRIDTDGLQSKATLNFINTEFEKWKLQEDTVSHDTFLADRAIACMQTFAPNVMTVAFGEIDCAHYGSWSRYVEAIRRTDELT